MSNTPDLSDLHLLLVNSIIGNDKDGFKKLLASAKAILPPACHALVATNCKDGITAGKTAAELPVNLLRLCYIYNRVMFYTLLCEAVSEELVECGKSLGAMWQLQYLPKFDYRKPNTPRSLDVVKGMLKYYMKHDKDHYTFHVANLCFATFSDEGTSPTDYTLMHSSASKGNTLACLEVMNALNARHCTAQRVVELLSLKNGEGDTPLHTAVKSGYFQTCIAMINRLVLYTKKADSTASASALYDCLSTTDEIDSTIFHTLPLEYNMRVKKDMQDCPKLANCVLTRYPRIPERFRGLVRGLYDLFNKYDGDISTMNLLGIKNKKGQTCVAALRAEVNLWPGNVTIRWSIDTTIECLEDHMLG